MRYDVTYTGPSHPENHMKPWTQADHDRLTIFFKYDSFDQLCSRMGRTNLSVLAKLEQKGLIKGLNSGEYFIQPEKKEPEVTNYDPTLQPLSNSQTPAMTHKNIETRTFIDGKDAAKISDVAIFGKIAELEAQLATWEAIQHKPDALIKAMAKLETEIIALGAYVDTRISE
jgi:hypothetical protein